MSKRLQVVMDDAEYDEIQEAAEAARLTVSAWVRQALRAARAGGPGDVPAPPAEDSMTLRPDLGLVRTVMARHGLATPGEAVEFALRRAAEPPLTPSDLLGLRGAGWDGDLGALRRADRADRADRPDP